MLPRQFHRVEWEMARLFSTPYDRVHRTRNFTTAEAAAAQVRAIRLWEPSHAELAGVFRTVGTHGNGDLKWEVVDPETGLPPLLPHDEARYRALAPSIPTQENHDQRAQ